MSENQAVEKQSNKKIAAGTILGYFGLGLSIISGLFFTPWIKENIGNSMYGLYTLGQSVINLFLLDFGLSNSVNAYLSKYRAEGNIDDENHFLTTALKMYLFIDLVLLIVFVVVYFLIEYIYAGLTAEEIPILKNVFIILAGLSLLTFPSSLYSGILKAYEEFGWIKIIEIANKVVYIVLTSISLMLNLGIYAVIFSYAFSSFINAFVLLLFARYKLKKKILLAPKTTWQDIRQVASFSAYSFVSSIAARLVFTIAPSVLGIVSDSTNIAVFGTCSSLEGYVYSFSSVMSGFFMPKIKRIAPSQDDPSYGVKLNELAIKVGRIQVSFVLLVIIGFVAVGNDMLDVAEFVDQFYGPLLPYTRYSRDVVRGVAPQCQHIAHQLRIVETVVLLDCGAVDDLYSVALLFVDLYVVVDQLPVILVGRDHEDLESGLGSLLGQRAYYVVGLVAFHLEHRNSHRFEETFDIWDGGDYVFGRCCTVCLVFGEYLLAEAPSGRIERHANTIGMFALGNVPQVFYESEYGR